LSGYKPAFSPKKRRKKQSKKGKQVFFNNKFHMNRISLTIVDTPGFGDNIDNERW
jgi:septin family protein